jgi:tetratricopeptide (TPR) repeat protein
MTSRKNLAFLIALSGTVTLSGCTLQKMIKASKDQQLEVSPKPLEVHKDSVSYEVSAVVPLKVMKPGKVYTIEQSYEYAGKEKQIESIAFEADKYKGGSDAPRVTKKFVFPYEQSMEKGNLVIKGVASNPKTNKSKSSDKMPIAEGLITTSKLVQDSYYAAYSNHGYNPNEELVSTNIEFYFEQGSSVLQTREKNSDRGKNLNAFIAEKNVTRTVSITGSHSPEGTERINSNLAKDRAAAIEKWYRQNMKKYDYKGKADSIKFVIKPVVEDWTMFSEVLKNYDKISQDEKNTMISIINAAGKFDEKENRLKVLPTYKKIFNEVYPKLRTAKTEIFTVKEKKSEAEITVLAKQIVEGKANNDALSMEELQYAAHLTPSVKEKHEIYKAAAKKEANATTHNNLGASYLDLALASKSDSERKDLISQAVTQFEISKKLKETAEVNTNLGVVYYLQGNAAKATASLKKAAELNPSQEISRGLNGVRGALEIRSAKYDEATQTLARAQETPENLFNKGLAQLLKKDYQNAITSFNEVASGKGSDAIKAKAHYASAIASARLKKDNDVFTSIMKAVQAEPTLKDKALNDLEFKNYQANDSFRNALK